MGISRIKCYNHIRLQRDTKTELRMDLLFLYSLMVNAFKVDCLQRRGICSIVCLI